MPCYLSEERSLEQAGHNGSGQVSKKMAKKVPSQREKVANNIGQQKSAFFFSVKVMEYSDVLVKSTSNLNMYGLRFRNKIHVC